MFFIRSRCAMALNDPTDDVEMIDDTSSTATIQIEWTRWWNKPSEHWPGYTSWEVLRWWAKRTRPWAMNSFPLFKYNTLKMILFGSLSASCLGWMMKMSKVQYRERRSRRPLKKVHSKFERV